MAASASHETEVEIDRRLGRTWLGRHVEVVTAVLLGFVSCMTAYAGFQAAMYDSNMAANYARASVLATQAESLYLEANQDYTQEAQSWAALTESLIDMESTDADVAARASAKYDSLWNDIISDDFAAAIERANAANEANPNNYVSPLDDETYLDALFGKSYETADESAAETAKGDTASALGDKLTLYTVLMTISLFLLGVAAVVKRNLIKFMLIGFSIVVFVVAVVLTLLVPFVALS